MFAALADNLDFFKTKINICLMLAPVTRIDRMSYAIIQKLKSSDSLFKLLEKGLGQEIMPMPAIWGRISCALLKMMGYDKFLLEDPKNVSQIGLETYFGLDASSSSFRNLCHFRQNLQTGKLAKFDFGPEINLLKYKQSTAPEYDLTRIRNVPIALFCGG
jgi:hypothetical protein